MKKIITNCNAKWEIKTTDFQIANDLNEICTKYCKNSLPLQVACKDYGTICAMGGGCPFQS